MTHDSYLLNTSDDDDDDDSTTDSGDDVSSLLREIYYDLEDRNTNIPAWQKKIASLTPDLDTQSFMGDVMQGNSYMTQRIPANWDDPE